VWDFVETLCSPGDERTDESPGMWRYRVGYIDNNVSREFSASILKVESSEHALKTETRSNKRPAILYQTERRHVINMTETVISLPKRRHYSTRLNGITY